MLGRLADRLYAAITLMKRLSRTINVINVKLCLMVVLLQIYTFIPILETLIVFQQSQTGLTENVMLSNQIRILYECCLSQLDLEYANVFIFLHMFK